jgi:threonine dehydrogenase-like Zn-dependent dehydrogenase
MRLAVIGAGIGGSMVARVASAAGHDVTVLADPLLVPASHAALCVVNPRWFKGQGRSDAMHALDTYSQLGAVTSNAARYERYDRTGESVRVGEFFAVDPARVLVEPDSPWTWHEGRPRGFDAVVLCLGAAGPTPGERTWGVTTLVDSSERGMYCRLAAPRQLLFSVNHNGHQARLGSSVAPTAELAFLRQDKILAKLPTPSRFGWTDLVGQRLMPTDEPGAIRHLEAGLWSLDGFGRVGYSLAPARAKRLVALL